MPENLTSPSVVLGLHLHQRSEVEFLWKYVCFRSWIGYESRGVQLFCNLHDSFGRHSQFPGAQLFQQLNIIHNLLRNCFFDNILCYIYHCVHRKRPPFVLWLAFVFFHLGNWILQTNVMERLSSSLIKQSDSFPLKVDLIVIQTVCN